MKTLVCYSSKTGNTKKIAEIIFAVNPFEKDIKTISRQANELNIDHYELIIVGYWAENNNGDRNTRKFLKTIKNKNIMLFGTMGTDITHPMAKETMQNIEKEIDDSNILEGHFVCRGEISKSVFSLFENMLKMQPHDQNLKELYDVFKNQFPGSLGRPDNNDLKNAEKYFKNLFYEIIKKKLSEH